MQHSGADRMAERPSRRALLGTIALGALVAPLAAVLPQRLQFSRLGEPPFGKLSLPTIAGKYLINQPCHSLLTDRDQAKQPHAERRFLNRAARNTARSSSRPLNQRVTAKPSFWCPPKTTGTL